MEAPEKIYLQQNTTTDCYEEWCPEWFEARAKDTDIEYTRTDTFMEKACAYLQKNLWRIVLEEGEFRQRFVTDFKNYMKGE